MTLPVNCSYFRFSVWNKPIFFMSSSGSHLPQCTVLQPSNYFRYITAQHRKKVSDIQQTQWMKSFIGDEILEIGRNMGFLCLPQPNTILPFFIHIFTCSPLISPLAFVAYTWYNKCHPTLFSAITTQARSLLFPPLLQRIQEHLQTSTFKMLVFSITLEPNRG